MAAVTPTKTGAGLASALGAGTTPHRRSRWRTSSRAYSGDTARGSAAARTGRPSSGVAGRAGLAPAVRLESAVPGRVGTAQGQAAALARRYSRGLPGAPGDARDPSARELGRRSAPTDARRRGRPGRGSSPIPRRASSRRCRSCSPPCGCRAVAGSRASRSSRPCSLAAPACSQKELGLDPQGLPSRLHSSGCSSTARRDGGLGAPALLDPLRRIPRHGRRAAAGARRRGRAVRRRLYDLLGIGRDDDSDRVMARFAVVRRERMVAW